MIGRLDDWLKVVAKREGITITPGHLDWGGIAVFKKAYGIFKARGYRARCSRQPIATTCIGRS